MPGPPVVAVIVIGIFAVVGVGLLVVSMYSGSSPPSAPGSKQKKTNKRRMAQPHANKRKDDSDDDDDDRDDQGKGAAVHELLNDGEATSLVELEPLKPITESSSVQSQSSRTRSELRARRNGKELASGESVSREIPSIVDKSIADIQIPYTPILPTPAASSKASTISPPPSPPPVKVPPPFIIESELSSSASDHSSPQVHMSSINASPNYSPIEEQAPASIPVSPHVQQSSLHLESPPVLSQQSISSPTTAFHPLSPPSLSMRATSLESRSASSLSFDTAFSPPMTELQLSSPRSQTSEWFTPSSPEFSDDMQTGSDVSALSDRDDGGATQAAWLSESIENYRSEDEWERISDNRSPSPPPL